MNRYQQSLITMFGIAKKGIRTEHDMQELFDNFLILDKLINKLMEKGLIQEDEI